MAGVADHETETQGALQSGPQQIPEAGRPHGAGAKSAARAIKSDQAREPSSRNEPPKRSEPKYGSEPVQSRESKFASESSGLREPASRSEPIPSREPKAASRRFISIPHNPTESQLHQSVAELLDWVLLPPAVYTTFPAGWGKLSKGTAGRLFASGLKRGMPDILIFHSRCKTVGIELKAGNNSVSSAQRTMFAKLEAVGIRTYVCRCQEDVLNALRDEGLPYRGDHNDRTRKQESF